MSMETLIAYARRRFGDRLIAAVDNSDDTEGEVLLYGIGFEAVPVYSKGDVDRLAAEILRKPAAPAHDGRGHVRSDG